MLLEPFGGPPDDGVQRTRFLEQVGRVGIIASRQIDDLEPTLTRLTNLSAPIAMVPTMVVAINRAVRAPVVMIPGVDA
jgi:hypothetical protein